MNLLEHLSGKAALRRLQGLDSVSVKNAFFANYLAALVLVKLKDVTGLGLVNDHAHSKLQSFDGRMSDLSFWGRALFYPTDKRVHDALAFGHAEILTREAHRILPARVTRLISYVMTPPDQVSWTEVIATLYLLRHRFNLQSSYYTRISQALMKWDSLGDAARNKAVYDSFMYLLQSDSKSNLLNRMRELTNKTVLIGAHELARKVIDITRLPQAPGGIFEDDSGGGSFGTSTGNIASGDAPVSSGNAIIDQLNNDRDQNVLPYVFNKTAGKAKKKAIKYEKVRKRDRRFKLIKFRAPTADVRTYT